MDTARVDESPPADPCDVALTSQCSGSQLESRQACCGRGPYRVEQCGQVALAETKRGMRGSDSRVGVGECSIGSRRGSPELFVGVVDASPSGVEIPA